MFESRNGLCRGVKDDHIYDGRHRERLTARIPLTRRLRDAKHGQTAIPSRSTSGVVS